MRPEEVLFYKCPKTLQDLKLTNVVEKHDDEIVTGTLSSSDGMLYEISNGIPDFTYPQSLQQSDSQSRDSYNGASHNYNTLQKTTFRILNADENTVRRTMIELLRLEPKSRVLETAAGTGLNFQYMIDVMGETGAIFAQDISKGMLQVAKNVFLDKRKMEFALSVGNAAYLPYSDNFFDAALSFGGIGVFSSQKRAIDEMCRVVKSGGRIVFGDEGVAPWLRNSKFGKILIDNNHFYSNEVPLDLLPVGSRDVKVCWIMGGAFYLVDFTVGEGEPVGNFDYPIPGHRGGTLNTRYHGKLEGVSIETKKLAQKARAKSNISLHEWLDQVVSQAARAALKD